MSITPEDHLAAVTSLVARNSPLGAEAGRTRAVTVPICQAVGDILASDVVAREDQPAFDNSQMDGYAVADTHAHTALVGPTIAAGSDVHALYPSGIGVLAAPIMTGAALPHGTRAIIPVECCTPDAFVAEGGSVRLPSATEGQFCRRAGSDIVAGSVIASAGSPLSPALFGALVAQGIEDVTVRRRARILVITGGAEIGGTGVASIRDVNGPLIEVLAARHGIDLAGRVSTDDDPATLAALVSEAIARLRPDAIVTSGGISHGKYEVIRHVFTDGWYGHVAQQPGGPQGWSVFEGVPVISLPGNPISTLVSFRLYVAPVLGQAEEPVEVPLGADVAGMPGREQFLRARVDDAHVVPVGGKGSHLLAQAAEATCLLRVPANARLKAGQLARVYPL